MNTTVFTATRLVLFGFGWAMAGALAVIADLMMGGSKWPVFGLIAGWWTFVCAVYVQGEAHADTASAEPQEP